MPEAVNTDRTKDNAVSYHLPEVGGNLSSEDDRPIALVNEIMLPLYMKGFKLTV